MWQPIRGPVFLFFRMLLCPSFYAKWGKADNGLSSLTPTFIIEPFIEGLHKIEDCLYLENRKSMCPLIPLQHVFNQYRFGNVM